MEELALAPVYSPQTIPSCRISSMDGIAIRSDDTSGSRERDPVIITDAFSICTGQEVPDQYDAIIPSEEISSVLDGGYVIHRPVNSGQHVRKPGDEVREGQLILKPGDQINPSDIGALLTYGIQAVPVRTLVVALIPTGDELVPCAEIPAHGQVRESNPAMLASALRLMGITPVRYPIVRDDPEKASQGSKRCSS